MFFFLAAPVGAFAQTSSEAGELLNRINQLENQIQTMSRAVYRGDKAAMQNLAASDSAGSAASVSGFEARLSQIEEKQRNLTGQLEKMNFDLQQIKDRMDRMQVDTEQRFQQTQTQPAFTSSGGGSMPTTVIPPVGTLGTLSSGPSEGSNGPAESLYEQAFASIRETNYEDAEAGFKNFLSRYPGHPLVSNAQYWLGETYYVRGDFKQAARTFAQGYQSFPKGPKAADSLLKLGLSLSKLDKKDDACLSLRQLQKEFHDDGGPLQRRATQEIKQLGCS